jgi:hypothetical protein
MYKRLTVPISKLPGQAISFPREASILKLALLEIPDSDHASQVHHHPPNPITRSVLSQNQNQNGGGPEEYTLCPPTGNQYGYGCTLKNSVYTCR